MESQLAQAVLLGALQGLTEFLPISSSGHLALAQQLLPGFNKQDLLLDVLLHVGTLAAVIAYFRADLGEIARAALRAARPRAENGGPDREPLRLVLGIATASVPTTIIGLVLEKRVEAWMGSAVAVGVALMFTGVLLAVGEWAARRVTPREGNPGPMLSLIIGIAQGIAVIPGLSRSGATIAAARAFGIEGAKAARFSLLISLPAVGGAALLVAVKNLDELRGYSAGMAVANAAGMITAAVVGYAVIAALMKVLKSGKFAWFSVYCLLVGMAAIIYGLGAGS